MFALFRQGERDTHVLTGLVGVAEKPADPGHDAVPFGLFDELAVLILVGFVRGQAQVADSRAVAGIAQFGVLPQVADEDNFVDSACHDTTS